MPGIQTSALGLVSRALPQPSPDGIEREFRLSRYGGTYVESVIPTKHMLADEGSYFTANNGTTSITGQTNTSFTNTAPTVAIANTDSAGNASSKRIYLDYIYLLNGTTPFTNATSNTGTFCAVIIDNVFPTFGGSSTVLTPKSVNMDMGVQSVALIRVGAMTITAPSANSRTLVAQRLVRAPVTATALTLANLDQFLFTSGGVDIAMALPNSNSATVETSIVGRTITMPNVVVGPGQAAYIYIFSVAGGAVTAGTFLPEIGWFER